MPGSTEVGLEPGSIRGDLVPGSTGGRFTAFFTEAALMSETMVLIQKPGTPGVGLNPMPVWPSDGPRISAMGASLKYNSTV